MGNAHFDHSDLYCASGESRPRQKTNVAGGCITPGSDTAWTMKATA